jgi:hypothetical protein
LAGFNSSWIIELWVSVVGGHSQENFLSSLMCRLAHRIAHNMAGGFLTHQSDDVREQATENKQEGG